MVVVVWWRWYGVCGMVVGGESVVKGKAWQACLSVVAWHVSVPTVLNTNE